MSLSFEWGQTTKCFDTKSPPISVTDVPRGSKTLKFRMTDLNAPDYPHGGGTVKYRGMGKLDYGAFRYHGPCPPTPHTYRIEVWAFDGGGKILAHAEASRRFP
jgi:hypothetical protein